MLGVLRSLLALALAVGSGPAAPAATAPGAEESALRQRILDSDSATAVLQHICSVRGPETIKARRIENRAEASPPSWVRAALRASPGEPMQYRHVRLVCGEDVLSVAENWYLPARLTPGMNRALMTTDTPFGVVARPMGFHRRTLAAKTLKPVLGSAAFTFVLRHRAVLEDARGRPISVVQESYTASALGR